MFKILSLVITLLFLAVGILLGVLNPSPVKLDLIFKVIQIPQSILLAITFSLGMLLTAFYFTFLLIQKNWKIRQLNKVNNKLTSEVIQLNKKIAEIESHKLASLSSTNTEVTLVKEN